MSVLELKMDEVGYNRVSVVGGALPHSWGLKTRIL